METHAAVRLENITKTFGSVIANSKVNLDIKKGEILSLLGENGSGKTTLMNMLCGLYRPDGGIIFVDEKEVAIHEPADAFDLGIGMVHQHFKLVDVFSAAENITLGMKDGNKLDLRAVSAKIKEICDRYGFDVTPTQKVYDMSVSQKQTVEIVKVLYRGANILILDEPTAVLTPQETEKLFDVMRNMKADGKSIVIITHKLHEVMAISDRVAVLRKGEYIGDVATSDTNPQKLTDMMVGRAVTLNIDRPEIENKLKRLEIKNLNVIGSDGVQVLHNVSFDAFGGEILGIAGISGSGQKQLLEAIAGLTRTKSGSEILYFPPDRASGIAGSHTPVDINGESLIGKTPRQIRDVGVGLSFVPEDRLGMGLVGSMSMTDNMMLKSYTHGKGPLLDSKTPRNLAKKIKEDLGVITPGISTPVSRLSGGNVQKVLVGREIAAEPTLLMTAYAVRGLDINTSYAIYHLLNEQKANGVCVIFVGEDLDVLLELCDRILVLCSGHVSGIVDGRSTTKEAVGQLMTQLKKGENA